MTPSYTVFFSSSFRSSMLQLAVRAELRGVGPTCQGESISTPCASNLDPSARLFNFCLLTSSGGAMMVGAGVLAKADAIIDPVDGARIGTSVYVECKFEAIVAEVVSFLGVADGPGINGKTAEISLFYYVPGFSEAPPSGATVVSGGTLLKYAGQPAGNQINFLYEASTQNPTLNPTPSCPPKSCKEVLARNPTAASGQYSIQIGGCPAGSPVMVQCNMERDGGGLVAQYAHNHLRSFQSS